MPQDPDREVGEFARRRGAQLERERDRLEAERWLAEDAPEAAAVALPPPRVQP